MRLGQACLRSGLLALEGQWWHVVLSDKVPHARRTVSALKHSTSRGGRGVEQMPAERHMYKDDSVLRLAGTRRERWDLEREDPRMGAGRGGLGQVWGWWLRRVSSLPAPAEWMWSPVAVAGQVRRCTTVWAARGRQKGRDDATLKSLHTAASFRSYVN